MWQRLRPVANSAKQKLGLGKKILDASTEMVVVQPEEVELHDRPAYLPGQLEKAVSGNLDVTTLEYEIKVATATELVHAPVLRYTLQDCIIHPAGVDFLGGSYRISPLRVASLVTGRIRRVPRAIYCMSLVSHQFFGHWLQDACATALLKKDEEALLLAERPDWPHVGEYLSAFGFQPESFDLLHVDRLTLYQDYGQGSNKRQRYAELRRRLKASYPDFSQGSPRVYLRRGTSGVARIVANEDAVIASLLARGFDIFDIAGASAREIYTRFRHAECVVSMEGSHLNHLYFTMPRNGKLMTFIQADRFTMGQLGYCVATGLRFGFIVVDPTPAGYQVSLRDLHATLDLMDL